MKLNKDNGLLEIELKGLISLAAKSIDKNETELIIKHLNSKHGIKQTNIYMLFNNSNNVSKLTLPEKALFGQQLVKRLGINDTEWLNEWFTEREIKEFGRYQFVDLDSVDEIEFPLDLYAVTDLGNGYYNATISRQMLARLYKNGKLNYNPNVQRGMRKVHRYGTEYEEPIIINSKVTQLKKLILEDKLEPSIITLNAAQASSEADFEIEYDKAKNKLTIHAGTVLDIVDGMHRTLATYSAYTNNKDIQGAYPVMFSNKSDEEVQKLQVNMDKHTPLSRSKILEYKGGMVKEVIDVLKVTGELSDKIMTTSDYKSSLTGNYLTTYKLIHNQVKEVFSEIDTIFKARQIAKQVNEYLVYLFGYFGKHQRDEYKMLFDADVFLGHIYLCKEMSEKNIPYEKLENILKLEVFHTDNPFWKDNKIINAEGRNINKDTKQNIISLFNKMLEEFK